MRKRSLIALLAADGVSSTGNILTLIAVPWFVLQTTGSATRTGIVAFFATLPLVVAGPIGGLVVDRLGSRITSVVSDVLSGTCVMAIALLHQFGRLQFWHVLVLVFFAGLMDVPAETARSAILPDIAEASGTSLSRATSAKSSVLQTAALLGGPLAGASIVAFGAARALYVDAATFAFAVVFVIVGIPRQQRRPTTTTNIGVEFAAGAQFIRRDSLIRAIVAMVMFMNFLDQGFFVVLLPLIVRTNAYGAGGLGLLIGAFGLGALSTTILWGIVGDRLNHLRTMTICLILIGAPRFLTLASGPSLLVAVLVLFATGIAAGPVNPILQTSMYRRVPADLRGRVIGTFRAGAYAAIPIGGLAAGFAVAAFGLRPTMIAAAGLYVLANLSLTGAPWRAINTTAAEQIPDALTVGDTPS